MVFSEVGKTTDAIVTVSEDLNPQLVIFLEVEELWFEPFERGSDTSILNAVNYNRDRWKETLTAASLSKRANSSLSSFTSSWALQAEDSWVKPTMSANRMLEQK